MGPVCQGCYHPPIPFHTACYTGLVQSTHQCIPSPFPSPAYLWQSPLQSSHPWTAKGCPLTLQVGRCYSELACWPREAVQAPAPALLVLVLVAAAMVVAVLVLG